MINLLANIDFTDNLLLNQVMLWMDGGSVTLDLADRNSTKFTVEFCQIMSLKRDPRTTIPGSFLLNGIEIPIRSDDERIILNALRQLQFSDKLIASNDLSAYRAIINERIAFVESNRYLKIAKEIGRL